MISNASNLKISYYFSFFLMMSDVGSIGNFLKLKLYTNVLMKEALGILSKKEAV